MKKIYVVHGLLPLLLLLNWVTLSSRALGLNAGEDLEHIREERRSAVVSSTADSLDGLQQVEHEDDEADFLLETDGQNPSLLQKQALKRWGSREALMHGKQKWGKQIMQRSASLPVESSAILSSDGSGENGITLLQEGEVEEREAGQGRTSTSGHQGHHMKKDHHAWHGHQMKSWAGVEESVAKELHQMVVKKEKDHARQGHHMKKKDQHSRQEEATMIAEEESAEEVEEENSAPKPCANKVVSLARLYRGDQSQDDEPPCHQTEEEGQMKSLALSEEAHEVVESLGGGQIGQIMVSVAVFCIATYYVITSNKELQSTGRTPKCGLKSVACCLCCTPLVICFPIDTSDDK